MKILCFTIIGLLVVSISFGQTRRGNICQTIEATTHGGLPVHDLVEKMPKYSCGKRCAISYLVENIKYRPKQAAVLMVEFVVTADGAVTNVKVWRPQVKGLDQHVAKVMSKMKWQPGTCDGQAVPVKMFLPITLYNKNMVGRRSY